MTLEATVYAYNFLCLALGLGLAWLGFGFCSLGKKHSWRSVRLEIKILDVQTFDENSNPLQMGGYVRRRDVRTRRRRN